MVFVRQLEIVANELDVLIEPCAYRVRDRGGFGDDGLNQKAFVLPALDREVGCEDDPRAARQVKRKGWRASERQVPEEKRIPAPRPRPGEELPDEREVSLDLEFFTSLRD